MLQMVRAGADPDSEGTNGFTALLHFSGRGNTEGIQELVRFGLSTGQIYGRRDLEPTPIVSPIGQLMI